MKWTARDGCCVWHPRRGQLLVEMNNGCPEVDGKLGLELIREAEDVKARRARAELYVKELRLNTRKGDVWSRGQGVVDTIRESTDQALVWLRELFPGAVPMVAQVDGTSVPWNR